MYPVYDVSVEGGRQALFQAIFGSSKGNFNESILANRGYGGLFLDPRRKSEWFNDLNLQISAGGFDPTYDWMQQHPGETFSGEYYFYDIDEHNYGMWYPTVDDSYIFRIKEFGADHGIKLGLKASRDGSVLHLQFEVPLVGFLDDAIGLVTCDWPCDEDGYPMGLEDSPDSVDVRVSYCLNSQTREEITGTYVQIEDNQNMICTPYGKLNGALIEAPLNFRSAGGFFGLRDGDKTGLITSLSVLGEEEPGYPSCLLMTGPETDSEVTTLVNSNSPNCPNIPVMTGSLEGTLENCKDDYEEYDWDHPITKPYPGDEPKGLSATKKYFIRVS